MKRLVVTFLLLTQISCSGVNELSDEPLFKTNFDDVAGWIPEKNLVYGNAYSGTYSLAVDSANEYSVIWKRSFLKLSKKTLAKVRVSAYAKSLNEKNNACIVVSIDAGDKNIYWDSIEFKKYKLNTKTWKKVESYVEIPTITDSSAQINVYLWGKEGSAVLIDDLEIEFAI